MFRVITRKLLYDILQLKEKNNFESSSFLNNTFTHNAKKQRKFKMASTLQVPPPFKRIPSLTRVPNNNANVVLKLPGSYNNNELTAGSTSSAPTTPLAASSTTSANPTTPTAATSPIQTSPTNAAADSQQQPKVLNRTMSGLVVLNKMKLPVPKQTYDTLLECLISKEPKLTINNVNDKMVIAITKVLNDFAHLEELNLAYNVLQDASIIALAEVLPKLPKLKVLDLSNNLMSDQGTEALIQALPSVPTLEIIRLENNQISDTGANSMLNSRCLSKLPKLKLIALSGNFFSARYIPVLRSTTKATIEFN